MSDKRVGAILTPSMREFFTSGSDESSSKARSIRQRMRERYATAIEDAALLWPMRDDDRRAIIDNYRSQQALDADLEGLLALFARELDTGRLESIVEGAVSRALLDEGFPAAEVKVNILIDRNPVDVSEAIQKLDRGEQLTEAERKYLVIADPEDVSDEEIEVLLNAENQTLRNVGRRLEAGEEWFR